MKGNFPIFFFMILASCSQQVNQEEEKIEMPPAIEFISEWGSYEYTIRDSLGNQMTFHQRNDSSFYDYFRFRPAIDDPTIFIPKIDLISSMWKVAKDSININLQSFSVGYPLEYEDILVRHIEAFLSPVFAGQASMSQHIYYHRISERMFKQKIYPVDSLLNNFGYRATGFSIEKVGNVLPEKLESLGFDPKLKIPVPYMVWINVENGGINGN